MKRWRAFALGLVTTSVAIGAACTFPDPDFLPPGATGDGGAGAGDGGKGSDGTTPEAAPPIAEAGAKPDTGPCADPCDCDKDGFRSKKDGCGGDDCDDLDPRAKPGANFSTEKANPDTLGDWNCDGTTERLFKNVDVSCGGIGDFCPQGREGLQADLPCGLSGTYVVCKPNALGCAQADSGVVTQECR